jgi:hypothetical protein
MINDEFNFASHVEEISQNFYINFFEYKESSNKITFAPFFPNILNFYMSNSISANSPVMGECSLFLNQKSNFNLDS